LTPNCSSTMTTPFDQKHVLLRLPHFPPKPQVARSPAFQSPLFYMRASTPVPGKDAPVFSSGLTPRSFPLSSKGPPPPANPSPLLFQSGAPYLVSSTIKPFFSHLFPRTHRRCDSVHLYPTSLLFPVDSEFWGVTLGRRKDKPPPSFPFPNGHQVKNSQEAHPHVFVHLGWYCPFVFFP